MCNMPDQKPLGIAMLCVAYYKTNNIEEEKNIGRTKAGAEAPAIPSVNHRRWINRAFCELLQQLRLPPQAPTQLPSRCSVFLSWTWKPSSPVCDCNYCVYIKPACGLIKNKSAGGCNAVKHKTILCFLCIAYLLLILFVCIKVIIRAITAAITKVIFVLIVIVVGVIITVLIVILCR